MPSALWKPYGGDLEVVHVVAGDGLALVALDVTGVYDQMTVFGCSTTF